MKYIILLSMAFATVASCAAKQTRSEPIYGLQLIDIHADFVVRSTGCTKAEDFTLEVTQESIKLLRMTPDNCRRKPFLTSIRLPFPHHNRGKAILNPLFLGQP